MLKKTLISEKARVQILKMVEEHRNRMRTDPEYLKAFTKRLEKVEAKLKVYFENPHRPRVTRTRAHVTIYK